LGIVSHESASPGNADALLKRCSSAGERDLILILDLSNVEYADSSGLGVLLYLDGVAQQAGSKLRLAGVTRRILELFQMTHTDKILIIDRDVASSLSHSAF
jgi:anti-sigma B factor antagonist